MTQKKKKLLASGKMIDNFDKKKIKIYSKQDLADFINKNYRNNCTQFTKDFTKLFVENDGTINKPYRKQWEFMNCLNPKDRVVIALKCRQCLHKNSLLELYDKKKGCYYYLSIESLHEFYENYKELYISTYDKEGYPTHDKVIDIWKCGKKPVYEIKTKDGGTISATEEHKFYTNNGWKPLSKIKLGTLLRRNKTFVSVVSKRLIGEHETYDLTTQLHSSYVAEGFHVHNSGFSTATVAKAFHDGYFGKTQDIVIISATKPQAIKVMRRIKQCFADLPEEIRPEFKVDQAQEVILPNNVRIISLSSNPNAARGWTGITFLDEFAMHTETESEELYKAVYPSTTKGGRIIIVSTPAGNKGMFYKLAKFSLKELSEDPNAVESKKFFIYWQDVPFIKEAVEKHGLFSGLTKEMIDQEYNLEFKNDDTQEQYFPRDFILATLREKGGSDFIDSEKDFIPFYTSYYDFGLPTNFVEDIELPVEMKYAQTELRAKYGKIVAGWDVASTENDSILVVLGELRDKPNYFQQIGEFFVNRIGKDSHSVIWQARYVKRVLQLMFVDKLTIDMTGLGRGVVDFLKQDKDVSEIINGFLYRKDNKFDGFVKLKQMLSEQRIKRAWDNNQTNEILKQCTNLRLNSINTTLKAKGNNKDDYPNALMLAVDSNDNHYPNITFI